LSIITWSRSAALAAALLVSACGPSGFRGTDITGADFGKDFALTDHAGTPRKLADFRGKAVVLSFGFAHCPDVCPTTLAQTAAALKTLGPDAERVQVLFVTVDPERDTQEVLAKYVPAFDARFLGLRGDLEATRATAKEFKVYFEKRAGDKPGSYSVDHSAQSYVYDPQGRIRLFVRHDRLAEDLAADLKTLLRGTVR
jgi:protein SCO1/2